MTNRKYFLGHLCVINSATEEAVVHKAALRLRMFIIYFGLHDQFREGDWNTIFDQSINGMYKNWHSNNPDNENGNEDCATYSVQYRGWNDINCDRAENFICEIDVK